MSAPSLQLQSASVFLSNVTGRFIRVNENTKLLMTAVCKATLESTTDNAELTEQQFGQLVEKLIYISAACILPQDTLAALAQALGTMSAFAARREGLPVKEVLSASQDSVATFAMFAESFMKDNPDFDPARGSGG
jgi:hypothetical protein